jgi:MFS family permease
MRDKVRVVLTVVRDPTLARVELAYLACSMAEYGTWMAVLVYAYGLGGAGLSATFALVQLVPSGIVAPFAAALGDRYPRDRLLVAGYVIQAVTMAGTAAVMLSGAPAVVTLGVASLVAVSFSLTRPIMSVILPDVTHSPADLTAANGVASIAEATGIFVGPLLGGLLLGASQPGFVFLFFAVTATAGAVLVARLPTVAQATTDGVGLRDVLADSLRGFAVIAATPQVRVLIAVLGSVTMLGGAIDILLVATAIDLLRAGDAWAGFLYAAFGLGGIIGAVATVSLVGRRRMTPALAASGGLFGAPIAAIAALPTIAAVPLFAAISGLGSSYANMAGRTLLQRVTPERVMARVFGVLEAVHMFALAAGSVLAGLIIALAGVGWALIAGGLLVPAVLAVLWTRLGALDRHARAPDPEALALLRSLPIFAPLSAPSMERILAELTWLEVPAGSIVVREGEHGDRFYVIADGRVSITVGAREVNVEGPGEYFGEIALLRDLPRTATVTALTPLRLLAIERDRFLEAITGHAHSQRQAEEVASARMANEGPAAT